MTARTPKPPVKVRATVRLNAYPIVAAAIERAAERAAKLGLKYHARKLSPVEEAALIEAFEREAMGELCDVLDFGDGE